MTRQATNILDDERVCGLEEDTVRKGQDFFYFFQGEKKLRCSEKKTGLFSALLRQYLYLCATVAHKYKY